MSWLYLALITYFRRWSCNVFSRCFSVSCLCLPLSCFCSSDVAPLSSPFSTRCLKVLLSNSLLLTSASTALTAAPLQIQTSGDFLGVAAWLPGAPQLCTSCMEPSSLLSTSLAPVSLFSQGWCDRMYGRDINMSATLIRFFRRVLNPSHPHLSTLSPASPRPL